MTEQLLLEQESLAPALEVMLLLGAAALIPALLLSMTSFVRIVVVLFQFGRRLLQQRRIRHGRLVAKIGGRRHFPGQESIRAWIGTSTSHGQ